MTDIDVATRDSLGGLAQGDLPVLETVALMNLDTLANCSLDERSYHLARLAALVALDAPPASYLVNMGLAADAGLTAADAQGVLVAVAPLVGSARVVAAAGNMLRGLGLAAALAEADGAETDGAESDGGA